MNEYDLYIKGLSIPQINEMTGTPLSTLRFRFKKAGILRDRAEAIKKAGVDGRLGSGHRGKNREFTKEWKANISKAKSGKGKGRSVKPNGYIEITTGKNKGRMEHSVVVEQKIGRRLFANECVHHINHNRSDNRIENLQLMTRSDHAALHGKDTANKQKRNKKGQFK